MRTSRCRGFTLAELMVVVVVIGLLAAIAMSVFRKTFSFQRKTACANHLEKLGQAYHTRRARIAFQKGDPAFPVMIWPQAMSSFLGGGREVFMCPEDTKQYSPAQTAREHLRQIYIEVFDSDDHIGNYDYHLWDVPMDEEYASQWVRRLSDEQFKAFDAVEGKGYTFEGYKPGADPTTYWFTFEDQGWKPDGGDKDYHDVMFKIQISDTAIVITPRNGGAAYSFNLSQGKAREKKILIYNVETQEGKPVRVEGSFGSCSYGMNSMASDLTAGSGKLLLLDYEKPVARGSDYDNDPDEWLENPKLFPTKTVDGELIPKFFRHLDKANVLFLDGTVRSTGFDALTIYDEEVREKYWNPKGH